MDKDPKKKTADAIVIFFYNNVQALISNYTIYKNILKELGLKYGSDSDSIKAANDGEKATIIEVVARLSESIEKSYINYETLCEALDVEPLADVKGLYEEISEAYVPDNIKVREYITGINKFLVKHVLSQVGSTIMTEVEGLYGNS